MNYGLGCFINPGTGEDRPSTKETIKIIHDGRYFPGGAQNDTSHWPEILQAVLSGVEDGSSDLVISSFGGALYYMRRSLIDFEILSMKKIFGYVPPDEEQEVITQMQDQSSLDGEGTGTSISSKPVFSASSLMTTMEQSRSTDTAAEDGVKAMTLDAIALTNLEILVNNFDRSEKGSLWAFINRCQTAFGRRLLKDWVCRPLFQPADIKKRSDAVEELLTSLPAEGDQIRKLLKSVPDLERLLARVHSNGLRSKGTDHPETRAVMYESQTYNTRKIKDFADTLAGFDTLVKIGSLCAQLPLQSSLLQKIIKPKGNKGGRFPLQEMSDLLKFYRDIFDEKQAKREGFIRPKAGVDVEYDQAKQEIAQLETFFEEYLKGLKREVGISDLKYFGSNKDRFQIEVPMNLCGKGETSSQSY